MTAATNNQSRPAKILAVDDNPAALYATSRILKSAGYEVIQAATGSGALAAAHEADLVVLDINLPDIDGFEVCRRLRGRPETAQLPVLHLSATFTQTTDFALGLEAGADSYLTRPVEPPVLLATVRTLLFARHADNARRGLDAKLGTIFRLAPIAIATTDENLRYDSVNPAFCSLTGYSSEELVGSPAATVFGPVARIFELEQGGQLNFERKDGTTAQVELHIAAENVSGARVIVMTDISYRIKTESEREGLLARERVARAEAERSNLLKEEFLATLSHELRNPLNAILGWATILGRTEGLSSSVMRGVQAIERNSRVQARMIADLLDYAGITFGKMRLAISTVDPYSVVKAALEVVASSAAARRVALKTSFDNQSLVVEADAVRLQQVVLNLLSNAIKFSPEGGEVEIKAARVGKDFSLMVKDHGKGISAEFLPRIFERFSQQDSSSTKSYGGLGLGLAIVRQLVDLHAGSIEVASAGEGQGATFTVRIPLTEKLLPPETGESMRLRSLDLSGVVALIVDDDSDARELTKRILSDAGAKVIEAANAEAALKCVSGAGANMLISDIGMAEKDGYQLIRTLRAQGFGADVLPAIALTAFARVQDRADAISAGFQEHVVKPIDPSTLIGRVSALRHSRRRVPDSTV